MAQRMESVAPPGAVMLSASTARLVDGAAALGEPEMVQHQGCRRAGAPPSGCWASANGIALSGVPSRLWSVGGGRCPPLRACWTVQSMATALWSAWWGHPASARAVWCARWRRWRVDRGVEVFTAFCESHTSQVPFHAVARLLRAATGVEDLDGQAARDRVRDRVPDADPEDLVLFDDLLGIADPNAPLPAIDPDARRRRLTALVNAASLARANPGGLCR